MWYLVTVLIGAVLGAVGMYFVAPKIGAIQQRAIARIRQLGKSG